MAPAITVFTDKGCTATAAPVILTLQKYYPVFTDSESTTEEIKFKYKGSNAFFFTILADDWVLFRYEALDVLQPKFVVTFDKGFKVKKEDRMNMIRWVQSIFAGIDDTNLNTIMEILVPLPTVCPEKIDLKNQIDPPKEMPTEYAFDSELQGCDCMLVQITKPHTDRPYTAAIRKFSERGWVPFFTALFISSSWGVCSQDISFLGYIWKMLGMNEKYGDMNLEQRLKDDVDRCVPGADGIPDAEPEVYRLTIMEVKELWSGKRKMIDQVFEANKK